MTNDVAGPSVASAGSQNTSVATARLSAANTWLQEEIKRLRLTDAEREAIRYFAHIQPHSKDMTQRHAATLCGLLDRLK